MPIQPQVAEILYSRNNFVKKLLKDAIEETSRLLRYCWENNHFSFAETFWQVKLTITYILFIVQILFTKHCDSLCLGCVR